MASDRKKFSASDKGKAIRIDPDPSKAPSIGPKLMSSAIRAHRIVPTRVDSRDSDRAADGVLGEEEISRRGEKDGQGVALKEKSIATGNTIDRFVSMNRSDRSIPFRYCSDGSIEQLPDIPPELCRPSVVEGQDWRDVSPTKSTRESVRSLLKRLKAKDVIFVVPRPDQRPWTPPIGYYCVYESLFGRESQLWFPIPRLITAYCARRDIALTQLMIGAVRIAVALMVMAAEVDISMSVRAYEELTQTQPRPNGFFAVQMRASVNVLTGHPSGSKQWHRSYFYVKADEAAFEEPPGKDFRVLWNRRLGR